eukprot:9439339-Prorocentrum_lima.AAC.1
MKQITEHLKDVHYLLDGLSRTTSTSLTSEGSMARTCTIIAKTNHQVRRVFRMVDRTPPS